MSRQRKCPLKKSYDQWTIEAAVAKALRNGFSTARAICDEIHENKVKCEESRYTAINAALRHLRFQKLAEQNGGSWRWLGE